MYKIYKLEIILLILGIILLIFNLDQIVNKKLIEVEIDKDLPKAFIFPNPNLNVDKSQIKIEEKIPSRVTSNTIYLTFDDGPSYLTNTILDILKKENVPATFFVIGAHIDEYKNAVRRANNEGHTIAIHSFTHKYSYVYLDDANYFNDLNQISEKIFDITGHHSHIVRLPGGSSNMISKRYNQGIITRITNKLVNENYYYFDWNVDSGDASGTLPKEQIYNNVTKNLHHGTNIVLMHDASPKKTTVEALEDIIKFGKENGYTFARITKDTTPIRHRINN